MAWTVSFTQLPVVYQLTKIQSQLHGGWPVEPVEPVEDEKYLIFLPDNGLTANGPNP
jgi:hypothetical protein